MQSFRDQRVFLTGASDGIGAALAVAFAREGARLALVARRVDKLEEVAQRVRLGGGEAIVCPADVTVQAEVAAAVAQAVERFGGIDIVVANAGIGDHFKLEKMDADRIAHVMDVNFNGAARTIQAVLPTLLAAGRGHVVGVASPAGFRGLPGNGAYSASKAALSVFLESLRTSLAARGIRVTTVHPGFVRTPLTAKNKFKMPFLLEPDDAADHILGAIRREAREYVFPWQIASLMQVVRLLPNALFDAVMKRLRA